ncbi:hypothetical protein LV779_15845 [Streptomyces thinghirensis]|nr:hypothetical protein [Streptomyces thinghirensis]
MPAAALRRLAAIAVGLALALASVIVPVSTAIAGTPQAGPPLTPPPPGRIGCRADTRGQHRPEDLVARQPRVQHHQPGGQRQGPQVVVLRREGRHRGGPDGQVRLCSRT